jgi:hypothetical protein
MCPPWIEGAHAGALQEEAFLTSMSATWYYKNFLKSPSLKMGDLGEFKN